MKRIALVVAAALIALTGCAQEPPPMSEKVQKYYDEHIKDAKATLPNVDDRPAAVFIGDSYTQGVGASSPNTRWTAVLAGREKWREINLGRGGTGYVTVADPANCGLAACPAYTSMIAEAVADKPSIVVVAGGQNDFTAYSKDPAAVEAAVHKVFQDLHNALPAAKIVAVGPSTPYSVEKTVTALDASVQREAKAVGATYVSLINPDVITPEMVVADRSHVNDSGHAAIAQAVAAAMG